MSEIRTERLRLVPATPALIEAELESPASLAETVGFELPPDWPPEHHDENTLRFVAEALEKLARRAGGCTGS